MASERNKLTCVTVLMAFFFFNSPTTFAAKPARMVPTEPYKAVTEFCNKRSTSEDREFCIKVLKSHPNSTSAKDNPSLLIIAVDLGIQNLTTTEVYMANLSKNKATNATLVLVLKECIPCYPASIGQLRFIPADMAADPPLASYDALMASDALISCDNSFNTRKIADGPVLSRHKIAKAYVQLCVDISMTIH
ncbi:putative invertase inhibitor [Coffea arabica]|uniref:Invertase inhibitor n=1 Tax=Coffea arabica TaxID=13443 RepID=A0ABM4VZI8_COFAR